MKRLILYPRDDLSEQYINTLLLHDETLGMTQRALKALRDELALRINHELLIFQVPSEGGAHCEIYGFFLVDRTAREIAIIGDGFRGDGGGEGGAGHRAALALLAIYHLAPILMMPEQAISYRDDISGYREITNKVLEMAEEYNFEIALQKIPAYIDWVLSEK